MTRLGFVLCLLLAGTFAGGQAEAHAALVEAAPADGAVVATVPDSVSLRFNEPVTVLVLRLIDATGASRAEPLHDVRDGTLTVRLPRDLPRGAQTLSYRVASSDGHPVGGSLVFSIGAPAAPGGRMAGMATGLAAGLWLSTLALYLGLLAGTGGAFFLAWPGRESVTPAGRGVVRAASGLGATAAVILVGLQGLDALGEELAALLTPRPWQAGIASPFGLTAVAALIALLCAWLAQRRLARFPALVGLLGAGLALTLSGHAGTAAPQWLTRPSVFIHGMAAAYWVGGLVPLALVVRERRGAALSALERFSSLAVPAVGLMALSGLVLGVVQIETPGALLATDYGRVFLVKMAAVAGLMALAGLNRWRLTPALRTRPSDAAALVRSILCEVALMVLILAAVAGWRLTPPPRALAASLSAPASLHIHDAAAMADMTIAPGRAGPVALSLSLLTGDFGPLDAREVTIGFSHPGAGIEPIERRAVREPDGSWRVEDLMLPVPGRWQVRVDALITDFDKATLEGSVEIAP